MAMTAQIVRQGSGIPRTGAIDLGPAPVTGVAFRPTLARRGLLGLGAAGLVLPAAPQAQDALVLRGRDGWLFPRWDLARPTPPEARQRIVRLLAETRRVLAAGGIDLNILLIPSRTRVYRDMMPPGTVFPADFAGRYAAGQKALQEAGFAVANLAEAFAAQRQRQPDPPLFFKTDTHWTPGGCAVAAHGMAMQLARLPALAPAGGAPRSAVTYREDEHPGDLRNLLPAADRRPYPDPHYWQPVITPQASAGAGLLDEPHADVAAIGSSFFHQRYGFAAMLGYHLNRGVSLAWNVHQIGPYKTMLDYVGSSTFQAARPKAIVWGCHELDFESPPDRTASWGQNAMPDEAFLSRIKRVVA
jgi:alginate O-acetyltransferase complex protein AlgJ